MGGTSNKTILTALAALLVCSAGRPALAKVTALQNGVSPAAGYAGCKDTWVSNEEWERNHNYGRSATLRCGGKRHILMHFDLAPIPKGEAIHKAVLRLAETGFPRRGREGTFASVMKAYALTSAWNENANWLEHTRTNWKEKDEGDWKTPGGEFDAQTDFGHEEKGLIATDTIVDGAWGHVHELDVTEVVKRWHGGKLANHGLLLAGGGTVASAEWPVPAYRPMLIIDHGPKAEGIPALSPAPKEIELDAVSGTPDAGQATGEHAVVRVGQNANCALRGKSADAYVKENVAQFPGTWGWLTQCRVGGVAGDFNRALLYFDLSDIPKNASIKQAKLVCSLVTATSRQVRTYRCGAFLLKLPEGPGWAAEQVTAAERLANAPWSGGIVACSSDEPLAIGKVTRKEIEQGGRKQQVDAGIEFDLTGAVRAWVSGKAPNCGIVLDNRIEGGAYDIYSSRSFRPELRPYLQISVSPAIAKQPEPIEVALAPPPGDYWVAPMREVHKRFKGTPGTLSQYGDSITVTMAYLAGYGWANKIEAKNMTPEVAREAELVQKHADLTLWRKWKEGGYGNTGMMMSDWLFNNVDVWQKKMNAEAAVIMFGTNDRGRIVPPVYTEYMAASMRRMMQDGTVPMLTSIPPPGAHEYWLAALNMAHGLKVPLIDYYGEIMRRRPDDYSGRHEKFKDVPGGTYDVPTLISRDGTHPSNPKKWQNDFSEEALSNNGYGLRNYMTIRMYAQIISKVVLAKE